MSGPLRIVPADNGGWVVEKGCGTLAALSDAPALLSWLAQHLEVAPAPAPHDERPSGLEVALRAAQAEIRAERDRSRRAHRQHQAFLQRAEVRAAMGRAGLLDALTAELQAAERAEAGHMIRARADALYTGPEADMDEAADASRDLREWAAKYQGWPYTPTAEDLITSEVGV